MDRQHRRELKHDRFVDEVGSLTARARENQRLLVAITAGAVLIAVVAYGIYFYRTTRERKAQDALQVAITAIDSPLVQPAQPGQPQNPDAKYKTAAERSSAAEAMFKRVQQDHSGTDAADVANIYLARIAAERNDVASARKLLQDFISEHPKHILVGAARYSLYDIRITNGEGSQVAAEVNQELAKKDGQALPGDALLSLLAKAYEAQGNSQQARDTYRRIMTEFPASAFAVDAQRRVGAAA